MLHLVAILFRLSWLLALFKLATTVFHLEFGISRHYLRLLEIIFRIGQEKFKIKEQQRRQSIDAADDGRVCSNGFRAEGPTSLERATASNQVGCSVVNETTTPVRRRRVGFVAQNSPSIGGNGAGPKIRRISTPDGPPVFLLDQCDDSSSSSSSSCESSPDDSDSGNANVNSQHLEERRQRQADRNNNSIEADAGNKITCLGDHHRQQQQQPPPDTQVGLKSTTTTTTSRGSSYTRATRKHEFQLYDPCKLVVRGIAAIIDDDVIKRFTPEQLESWNLLTRTNAKNYQFMSRSMGLFWLVGLLMRYLILLPLRIMFTLTGLVWLISTMSLIGILPKSWRHPPYRLMSLMSFRMLACGLTSRLAFHNRQYRAQLGDICVANHTSPLDVVLLACDNCYALVGQRHGGILGLLEMALSRATEHVWFDRAEMRDRQLVTRRLKEHTNCRTKLPVLIFPEGTCINNSAVMMFRKGSFETTNRVCPVAIKYDPRFGDPFWNSSKQSYVQYLLMMMSSWAIKCDVWYLPPMERLDGETSAEFANRVKAEIAKQGGLDDLAWDGQLKRTAPKTLWRIQQQEDYANRLKLE